MMSPSFPTKQARIVTTVPRITVKIRASTTLSRSEGPSPCPLSEGQISPYFRRCQKSTMKAAEQELIPESTLDMVAA